MNIKKLREEKDVMALIRALQSKDPDVRFEAAEALGNIGDEKAVNPLVTVLKTDAFSGIRWKAAEALSKIGNPAVDLLIMALQHADDDVRWKSAVALGEIGNPHAIEPLITLLGDDDRFVKSRAAHALGMIGEPALGRLIHALRTGDGNQRWGAAIALGEIRDPRATEPLLRALADRYENVRAEAAAALCAIGRPAVVSLISFLKFADRQVRIEVVTALGELGSGDAIEPLVQLLENADDDERRAVGDALDAILTPAAESLIRSNGDGNVLTGGTVEPEDQHGQ